MVPVEVMLPCGFAGDGDWHRDACLHPLSGREEAFLCEDARFLLPAHWTTKLLARTLARLGSISPVSPEAVKALTVGDRDALLLHLRRITLGERMGCVLTCPNEACGERMDLDIHVRDLLLPPYAHQEAVHQTVVETGSGSYGICFRLPTGADQEHAATLAASDMESAVRQVLTRCIERLTLDGIEQPLTGELPNTVADRLTALMAHLDPQAELNLSLTCLACAKSFSFVFDPAEYVFSEVVSGTDALYREVHLLASRYHWSETDILGMSRQKRRRYLDLLTAPSGVDMA